MKILVTGGAGTVGTPLVEELSRRGHSVISCDLQHGEKERGFSVRTDVPQSSYVRCDVADYRQLRRLFDAFGPFDYVYHAAAEFGRWNGEDFYEQLWRSNAVGTKNVIRLQEEQGFRLIHFSSSEVYGDWSEVMAESVMEQYEIKQMNDYALSKWVNEAQVRNSAIQFGTESVVIRLFNLYGPGEFYSPYRSVNCRLLYCALHELPFVVFRGHERTSTYVSDAVATIANIVDNFIPSETYNIGSDQLHTIEDLARMILHLTDGPAELVDYRDAEILTTASKRVDVSKSVRDLGHRDTVTLEEGLRATARWMCETYALERPQVAAVS